MTQEEMRSKIMSVVSHAAGYCALLENAGQLTKREFVVETLKYLPRLYEEFSDDSIEFSGTDDYGYFASYVDEDYYESVRRNVEIVLGADDVFLETFEEDMKYSDTPVAASISESLADIFQSLYNFVGVVKDSEGENGEAAFRECRDNFEGYWAQTLCNVMRALNHLRYSGNLED